MDGMGWDGVMEMMGKSEDHVGKLESKSYVIHPERNLCLAFLAGFKMEVYV